MIEYWKVCILYYIVFLFRKEKNKQKGNLKYLGLFNNGFSHFDYEESYERMISE